MGKIFGMDKLLAYLNSLARPERVQFAERCGTTEGYLRKACCIRQSLGADLCIAIERESSGAVRCEDLRPDVDWKFIRSTKLKPKDRPALERSAEKVA